MAASIVTSLRDTTRELVEFHNSGYGEMRKARVTWRYVVFTVVAVGVFLDLASTALILSAPGGSPLYETNPAINYGVEQVGLLATMVSMGVVSLVIPGLAIAKPDNFFERVFVAGFIAVGLVKLAAGINNLMLYSTHHGF